MKRKSTYLYAIAGAFLCLGLIGGLTINNQKAKAVSASEWQAGRIIDDAVFRDASRMSVADIQAFLNSKTTCDTEGKKPSEYGGGTRAEYGTARGNPPPYICLKDYTQDGKTAAQIIYDVSQLYKINPQVMLVLLQKEQNLVLDEWPWSIQYQSATGYGCPDTAPCATDYYGFKNQVTWAAKMFNAILDNNPNWYTPYVTGSNFVQWNPSTSCGGTNVSINNEGTSALYNYTPYQPNKAALDNMYGSGDSCSAYGNRNFWRYFNDWYGPTLANYSSSDLTWNREELDGPSSTINPSSGNLGAFSKTISHGNVLHTFYYDAATGDLKRAWADATGWHFEVVDGNSATGGRIDGDVGKYVTTTSYGTDLKVAYYNATNATLRMATLSGATWSFQTIDGDAEVGGKYTHDSGRGISMVQYGTSLQLFYYDATWNNLRHAWSDDGATWKYENIDGDYGSVAKREANLGQSPYVSTFGKTLQLFYYDASSGNLRHGWSDHLGWHFENLDGENDSVSRKNLNVGLYPYFIDLNGSLQLYYYNESESALRHAWSDSRGWHFEDLDGTQGSVSRYDNMIGKQPFVTYFNNMLRIYYFDETLRTVREARSTPEGWKFGHLDGINTAVTRKDGSLGEQVSGAIHGDSLQLFNRSAADGSLRHLWGVVP